MLFAIVILILEHLIIVNSRAEFETEWSNLSKSTENIGDVYLFTHANGLSIMLVEGSNIEALSITGKNRDNHDIGNLNDLYRKYKKTKYISVDSSSNIDVYLDNHTRVEFYYNNDRVEKIIFYLYYF